MTTSRVERVADEIIAADSARLAVIGRAGKDGLPAIVPEARILETALEPQVARGGGVPRWVYGGLLAIVVLLLIGGGLALGLFTTAPTSTAGPEASPGASSPGTAGSTVPTASGVSAATPVASGAALEFPADTVFDGCLVVDPQGNTTVLAVAFTVFGPLAGDYRAVIGQGPTGPLSGTGAATNGINPIVVPMRATAFGTYGNLSITAPDGKPVDLGPLAAVFPFALNAQTDRPTACQPSALATPTQIALAGRAYLAAVGPVNAAQGAFATRTQAWSAATTNAQAQADAAALLAVLQTVDRQMLDLATAYPPASPDLQATAAAVEQLSRDLMGLGSLDSIGVQAWLAQYQADLHDLSAASSRVRADLGLPALQ